MSIEIPKTNCKRCDARDRLRRIHANHIDELLQRERRIRRLLYEVLELVPLDSIHKLKFSESERPDMPKAA